MSEHTAIIYFLTQVQSTQEKQNIGQKTLMYTLEKRCKTIFLRCKDKILKIFLFYQTQCIIIRRKTLPMECPHIYSFQEINLNPVLLCSWRSLSLGTVHIWGQVIPCCGGCPVHCRVQGRIPWPLFPRCQEQYPCANCDNPKGLQEWPSGGKIIPN